MRNTKSKPVLQAVTHYKQSRHKFLINSFANGRDLWILECHLAQPWAQCNICTKLFLIGTGDRWGHEERWKWHWNCYSMPFHEVNSSAAVRWLPCVQRETHWEVIASLVHRIRSLDLGEWISKLFATSTYISLSVCQDVPGRRALQWKLVGHKLQVINLSVISHENQVIIGYRIGWKQTILVHS